MVPRQSGCRELWSAVTARTIALRELTTESIFPFCVCPVSCAWQALARPAMAGPRAGRQQDKTPRRRSNQGSAEQAQVPRWGRPCGAPFPVPRGLSESVIYGELTQSTMGPRPNFSLAVCPHDSGTAAEAPPGVTATPCLVVAGLRPAGRSGAPSPTPPETATRRTRREQQLTYSCPKPPSIIHALPVVAAI